MCPLCFIVSLWFKMTKVNLKQKLSTFTQPWVPKVVGELNGQYVKVVKLEGEYVWHRHAGEDELFLVVERSEERRVGKECRL